MDVQTLKVCMLFFLRSKDIFGDWIPTVCNNEHLMDGREKKINFNATGGQRESEK